MSPSSKNKPRNAYRRKREKEYETILEIDFIRMTLKNTLIEWIKISFGKTDPKRQTKLAFHFFFQNYIGQI